MRNFMSLHGLFLLKLILVQKKLEVTKPIIIVSNWKFIFHLLKKTQLEFRLLAKVIITKLIHFKGYKMINMQANNKRVHKDKRFKHTLLQNNTHRESNEVIGIRNN